MTPTDNPDRDLLARGGLLVPDVAALFTTVRQEMEDLRVLGTFEDPQEVTPVSERTVLSFIDFSQPRGRSLEGTGQRLAGGERNRYEDNPMPLPVRIRNQIPVWVPDPDNPEETLDDVRDALKAWYVERLKAG